MPETMKAALLYGDEDIRYEDVEVPEVKAGMVKVRVRACGIAALTFPEYSIKARFTIRSSWAMSFPARWSRWRMT